MQIFKRFLCGDQLRVMLTLDKEDLKILTDALDLVIFDPKDKNGKENALKADFVRLSKYLALSKKKNEKTPVDSSKTEDQTSENEQ